MSDDDGDGVEGLPQELRDKMRGVFDKGGACKHCGGIHNRACPRIRRMAFHPNGALSEVEFWPDRKWSDDAVVWPEDVQ